MDDKKFWFYFFSKGQGLLCLIQFVQACTYCLMITELVISIFNLRAVRNHVATWLWAGIGFASFSGLITAVNVLFDWYYGGLSFVIMHTELNTAAIMLTLTVLRIFVELLLGAGWAAFSKVAYHKSDEVPYQLCILNGTADLFQNTSSSIIDEYDCTSDRSIAYTSIALA